MSFVVQSLFRLILVVMLCSTLVGCASSAPSPNVIVSSSPIEEPVKDSELVEIPIVVTPNLKRSVDPGTRIVVADIAGFQCGEEVKDALMRRLIDNTDYIVLSRDNLRYLVQELEQGLAGPFNSKTVARIGELWGASLFVFGRIAYCGPSSYNVFGQPQGKDFSIFATLHIVDVQTGEVVVSSAAEGKYVPRPSPYSFAADNVETGLRDQEDTRSGVRKWFDEQNWGERGLQALRTGLSTGDWTEAALDGAFGLPTDQNRDNEALRAFDAFTVRPTEASKFSRISNSRSEDSETGKDEKGKKEDKNLEFTRIRAAEDLANSFADKFFARPTWEKVEMWHSREWAFSEAVRFVKLGHCRKAVNLFEKIEGENLELMTERQIAEQLHNYGVALLCANQPKVAAEKLRAAYRVGLELSTLKMLGLAARLSEWSMNVEVNEEAALQHLVARNEEGLTRRSVTLASSKNSSLSNEPREQE